MAQTQLKLRATPAARWMARINDIGLADIPGSGPGGRIHRGDVERTLREGHRNKILATPLAKRMAQLEGVDLETLSGTGRGGKIRRSDVMNSLSQAAPELTKVSEPVTVSPQGLKGTLVPLDTMREVIGRRMSESFFAAPTFTLNMEVNMNALMALRKQVIPAVEAKTGFKPTLTDFIMLAVARTLQKHPSVNASITEEGLFFYEDVNVALAVGLDNGLMVPVLRHVDRMTLSEVVTGCRDLSSRAQAMKLKPDEQIGSTFTISNLGMFGVSHFNPIINQPNSAILGIGASTDRFIPDTQGAPVLAAIMMLSLTIDHRIVDGAPGARFLSDIKALLENPASILV